MTVFRIGESELDLRIIGAGVQGGALPDLPEEDGDRNAWNLDPVELSDLEAFEAAGWRFRRHKKMNWQAAREINGGEVEAGLLARHPRGGLVIVRDHLIVRMPPEMPPETDDYTATKLPLEGDLYDVRLRLPDFDLEDTLTRNSSMFLKMTMPLDGNVVVEPLVVYRLVHPGRVFSVQIDPDLQWQWPKIRLTEAWAEGASFGGNVRVGVIDLGFHPNEAQIQPNVASTVFVNDRGQTEPGSTIPTNAHGTFCAGLIAALRDTFGVNGAAPECALTLVAVQSITTQVAVAKAIDVCSERGMDVVSGSIGPTSRGWDLSTPLKEAIERAHRRGRGGKGMPIVWSDFDANQQIPANSLEAHPGIICVGQSNRQDVRISSGFGPGLDLLAPGAAVAGLGVANGRSFTGPGSGCSFAAPIVAGVVALVLAKRPGLTSAQVFEVLTQSCDPVSAVAPKTRNDDQGFGRVNAFRAVQRA